MFAFLFFLSQSSFQCHTVVSRHTLGHQVGWADEQSRLKVPSSGHVPVCVFLLFRGNEVIVLLQSKRITNYKLKKYISTERWALICWNTGCTWQEMIWFLDELSGLNNPDSLLQMLAINNDSLHYRNLVNPQGGWERRISTDVSFFLDFIHHGKLRIKVGHQCAGTSLVHLCGLHQQNAFRNVERLVLNQRLRKPCILCCCCQLSHLGMAMSRRRCPVLVITSG